MKWLQPSTTYFLLTRSIRAAKIQEVTANLQKQKQEQAMRSATKMIQMMKGKALTSTFMAWKQYAKDELADKVKILRYLAKWKNQGVSKCLIGWKTMIAEDKKYKTIVKKFVMRMNNGCVVRVFQSWIELVGENKRNKIVIERFRKRFANMEVAKAMGTWCVYKLLRKRARYLAQRILNRANNGRILSAWLPWIEFVHNAKLAEEREANLKFTSEKEQVEEKKRIAIEQEFASLQQQQLDETIKIKQMYEQLKIDEAERKQVSERNRKMATDII